MNYRTQLFISVLLLFNQLVSGQQRPHLLTDPLEKQFYLNRLAKSSAMLFVHFDKNIYTNNESVWFTGYLLNELEENSAKHNILSVALIRDADSTIIKQQKFIMSNSLAYGSMTLPDSLLAGNYHFMASTNRVTQGLPDVSFIQPILIKTNTSLAFNANVKILEPGIAGKKPSHVLLSATTPDARFLPGPVNVTYRYGNLNKKAATNTSGELILKIDEQVNLRDPNLYLKLIYRKDSSFLNLALPVTKQRAQVHFYPEGGNLINGNLGRIGWEARDQQLAVVALKAQLYKNDQVIDTIETNSNGIGSFFLIPEMGSTYKVKLLHTNFTDSTYNLPLALNSGLGIYVPKALVKDTLSVQLKTKEKGPIFIRVHNFRETFIYNETILTGTDLRLKIPLETVPKGLHTITISDSVGRPLTDRMFFAHYDPDQKITINTDQKLYGQREKVTLKIKLNERDSLGFVSIACIQDARLSSKLNSDIESYTYLTSELNNLPPYNNIRGYEDPVYMEDILLIKGWSRYTWTDFLKTTATDTIKSLNNTNLTIQVTGKKKPIVEPVQIGLLKSNGFAIYTTDNFGKFEFPVNDLVLDKEKSIFVFVNDKDKEKYRLQINDPYLNLNKSYLKVFAPNFRSVPSAIQNNRVLSIKSNESAFQLKEVNITSGNRPEIRSRLSGSNRCGDYVCRYNILNCINHFGDFENTQPIPGKLYHSNGGMVVYQACTEPDISPGMIMMDGIYTKKEFYINDYAEPLEPAFPSTIYWNYGTLLNNENKEFTFYTSDITGKFKVIVQGISEREVLYSDYTFEVKGK
ncbi:hypothetical protein [Pedobacter nyackensis]|uniref:hypothetical protein n=1 Tax=Pedobacter nyackensis TaxID=475255 RepID=UPI002931E367|nr:hypothetical protein [Pedobacter nyackensis]